jgi:hypothetical protein
MIQVWHYVALAFIRYTHVALFNRDTYTHVALFNRDTYTHTCVNMHWQVNHQTLFNRTLFNQKVNTHQTLFNQHQTLFNRESFRQVNLMPSGFFLHQKVKSLHQKVKQQMCIRVSIYTTMDENEDVYTCLYIYDNG